METYVNGYEFEVSVTTANGDTTVPVKLRLTAGAQIAMKKLWKETTTSTLFAAGDDIQRFVDVLDRALKFPGNQNQFKSGEELVDAMASAGMLGLKNRQRIMTALGEASGLFDKDERKLIDDKVERAVDGMFSDSADGDEGDQGND